LDGLAALAVAEADGSAEIATGTCWTVPGWAPGAVDTVTGAVVVVVVSAWAGPDEKATRPKTATAPASAAGAARRRVTERRVVFAIT